MVFKEYNFWVYILFDKKGAGTYIGVTNDLERRVIEHKMGLIEGFSKEKNLDKLGWYEHHKYIDKAILREKQLKKWERAWKYRLIESMNPYWKDLAESVNEYIANMPNIDNLPAAAFGFVKK